MCFINDEWLRAITILWSSKSLSRSTELEFECMPYRCLSKPTMVATDFLLLSSRHFPFKHISMDHESDLEYKFNSASYFGLLNQAREHCSQIGIIIESVNQPAIHLSLIVLLQMPIPFALDA